MNAAEKIQAAIDKLEALKAESTVGPWAATRFGVETVPAFDLDRFDTMSEVIARTELLHADTDLIVTLHRTIDAQLAILRGALESAEEIPEWPVFGGDKRDLALAEAILGGA